MRRLVAHHEALIGIVISCMATTGWVGCAQTPAEQAPAAVSQTAKVLRDTDSDKASPHRIAIVRSDNNQIFDNPIATFTDYAEATSYLFTLSDYPETTPLANELAALEPSLIFTLGTRATLFVRQALPDTPTLFAMVYNHRRHALDGDPNVAGISVEGSPAGDFLKFKMVAPHLKQVLVFYNPAESGALINSAQKDLSAIDLRLIAVPTPSPQDVERLYQEHSATADAVWILSDPVVMNRTTFGFLKERAFASRIPLLSSLSERFAHAGVLMDISADHATLGTQAASLARMILDDGVTPGSLGIQAPIGSTLTVNLTTARQIGLEIPPDIMPYINKVLVTDTPAD